jgi:L-ribulokinase
MHAAVAAGVHPDIRAAAAAMGKVTRDAYVPDKRRADAYDVLYEHYVRLHDHFGRGGDDVMHRLREVATPCAAGRAGCFGPRPRELARG